MSRQPDNSYRSLGRRMLDGQRRQKGRRVGSIAQRPIVTIYPHSPMDVGFMGGIQLSGTCPDSTGTPFTLEPAANVRAIFLDYAATRGGTLREAGRLRIVLNAAQDSVFLGGPERDWATVTTGCGLSFNPTLSGGNILLTVIVDASSGTDVEFYAQYTYIPA